MGDFFTKIERLAAKEKSTLGQKRTAPFEAAQPSTMKKGDQAL